MDTSRKKWNARQKELRALISDPKSHSQAIQIFLKQHAEVHSRAMSSSRTISFEDEILEGLSDVQVMKVPDGQDHSIAWILWHISRIEDVVMNILVAGERQVFVRDKWEEKMETPIRHTGNAMTRSEVVDLSKKIDFDVLKRYRLSVGRRTREIVKRLEPDDVGKKISASRFDKLLQEGSVKKEAHDILDYWSRRTIAGLLLMPPTRHSYIHLNEAARIKNRLG